MKGVSRGTDGGVENKLFYIPGEVEYLWYKYKLDAATKVTKRFSNPQALSSTLAALGMLQPWAFGLLNRLVTLVLASDYYLTDTHKITSIEYIILF